MQTGQLSNKLNGSRSVGRGSVALPETADSLEKKQIFEESAKACVAFAHEPGCVQTD